MHYRGRGTEYAACGAWRPNVYTTRQSPDEVACIRCRKVLGFPVEPKPKKVPAPLTFDFEITEDVKKALRYVGKTMGAWAERTNQCNVYDQGIAHLNTKLPEGVKVPGRYSDWKIKIENSEGESLTTVINAVSAKQAMDSVKWAIQRTGSGLEKAKITVVGEVE